MTTPPIEMLIPTTPPALVAAIQAADAEMRRQPIGSAEWIPRLAQLIKPQISLPISFLTLCAILETYIQVVDAPPPPETEWLQLLPDADPWVLPGKRVYLRRDLVPATMQEVIQGYVAALRP